jgi:Fe(3+) dicitrate transport protein
MRHQLTAINRVILLLLIFASSAQAGQIQGVVDDLQGNPVVGARVLLEGTNYHAVTSPEGNFVLDSVPDGIYALLISAMGYQSFHREITVSGPDTLSLSFGLEVKPLVLDEMIVVRTSLIGNRNQLFRTPGSAHYLEVAELQKFKFTDVHQILKEMPGMNIQEEDGYGLRPNIGFRGTGADRSQKISVMEDGILISPAPYAAPAAYYFPTIGRMHGIEVRKGSSQVKYGPYTTGGALNLISTPFLSEFGGQLDLSGGQDNARRLHASVSNSMENFGYVAET